MTQNDTLTPFIDLIKQWSDDWHKANDNDFDLVLYVALQATRWGAAQELEACCELLNSESLFPKQSCGEWLRNRRRPKPPSLKEQALGALYALATGADDTREFHQDLETIKQALESLPS